MQPMNDPQQWTFYRFGLIVTGRGEERFLPLLFRALMARGKCMFRVVKRIGQRSPLTSEKKILRMVGTGKRVPDKDEEDIYIPVRGFLNDRYDYILIIDDMEADRAAQAEAVYGRYRAALDLLGPSLKKRTSVHFLVNMIEAYYFADPETVNSVLHTNLQPQTEDVETIPHPKGKLKRQAPAFDEVEHGEQIVRNLDVQLVLSNRSTCAFLRVLFAWCTKAMGHEPTSEFCLDSGVHAILTGRQLACL